MTEAPANLRVLQVTEVKSVPSVPLSHPFVERLIGTLRRECVDQLLFWSASDLEDKLVAFQGLLQCASGPCVVGRADARPDTKGCRTARPLPMGRALPWSLSDADRGVTSDQRRRWRAGRRARVRRLSRHSRAVRQLHALLMPSRQLRGGLPAHGTRRSNDVGFLRIRHPHVPGCRRSVQDTRRCCHCRCPLPASCVPAPLAPMPVSPRVGIQASPPSSQSLRGYCQVDEKLVDRPPKILGSSPSRTHHAGHQKRPSAST